MNVEHLARLHAEAVIVRNDRLAQQMTGAEQRRVSDSANNGVWEAERALACAIGMAGIQGDGRAAGDAREPSESWWLVRIGRDALASLARDRDPDESTSSQ